MKSLPNLLVLVLLAIGGSSAWAEDPSTVPSPSLPYAAAVLSSLDREADPCQDFYRFACGGWLDKTELPSDQSRWVRSFSEIRERNREVLRGVLEDAAGAPGAAGTDRHRIGHFYGSCMDEKAIEESAAGPLAGVLAQIDEATDRAALFALAGRLQRVDVGVLMGIGVLPDFKNPDLNIAIVGQGGLGLPDRDYYLSDDPQKKRILAAYEEHVARILRLLGAEAEAAAAQARQVLELETRLARASRPRAEMRIPERLYNRLDREGLEKLAPTLPWGAFFAGLGAPELREINVSTPEFMEALEETLAETPVPALQTYLRWHVANAFAEALSAPFVEATFDFYGKTLQGQRELEPRWKRCVAATEQALGEAVGRLYVEREFAGDSKEIALAMIHDIEGAFAQSLPALAWMDDPTRQRALEKMKAIQNKIGYPDQFRDYSQLAVAPGGYFANVLAAREFESDRQVQKIGRPVDETEWRMTPQMVNAYYNPLVNEIAFPAGILQPPFFRRDHPAAMNYGAIGAVMGHELTHGFDDQGRKFDPQGRLQEWWAPEVARRFEDRARCVERQYSGYEVEPGVAVQGELTLGENIADNGGLKQAYDAYKGWEAQQGEEVPPAVPGLTNDQLFFVSYAQVWCAKMTPEAARMQVTVDPHSPARFRVIGAITNHPAFGAAFQCAPGTPMNPVDKCQVW